MLLTDAVGRVNAGIGFRPALNDFDNIAIRFQEAQRDLEMGKTLPKFLLRHDAVLSITSGVNYVALPSDFIREEEEEPIRYTPTGASTPVKIMRRVLWEALSSYASTKPAGPKVYTIRWPNLVGDARIDFEPIPDKNYSLLFSYYAKDAPLNQNIENTWLRLVPELIIGEAGYRYTKDIEHQEGMTKFDDMRKAARLSLFGETVAQDDSGGPISLGSAL